ncbi:MAG: ABC transporter permease subunit [Chloroflexi bacterium]|jgi:ABC-2 type transport system permease protein|nr:ABC transporter permease subunit [Chloroflexota bacterium]
MVHNVFAKSISDRWRGMSIASFTLGVFFLFGMAVYKDIDLGFYNDFPEAMRSMMNISEGAGVGSLAYGAIYGLYGSLVLSVMAIIAGAGSFASEERNGSMGLLLGNPKSRNYVLTSKTIALVILLVFSIVVMGIAGRVVPMLLGVEVGGMEVESLMFHLFVNAVFYGMLATAIGGWTGNGGLAIGVSAGVLIVGMLGAGLLPLISGAEDFAKIFPWYYFDGSQPIINGVDWGHVSVLGGASVIFFVVGLIGVNRRDLKAQSVGTTLVDRLRSNPMTQKMVERVAGSARVSHIWVKTASEHQILLIAASYYMFLVGGVLLGPVYTLIDDSLVTLSEQLPETLMALAGGGDMSTPEGFYTVENFGLMAPIIFLMVAVVVGARALAGEESKRTMGLLLANPISRSRIVYEKMFAMVVLTLALGFVTFAGTAVGSLLGGLDMSYGNIAAISLLASLLGLTFGALALALSAATGRVKFAVFGSVGPALVFYLMDSFLPLNDSIAGYAKLSPFYYYSGSNPLANGMHWGHGGLLAGLTIGLVVLAAVLFERRDLRQQG